MDLKRLTWSDFVGFLGAGVLALSLWLPWFHTDCEKIGGIRRGDEIFGNQPPGCNENSVLKGDRGELESYGDFTAWETFARLDWLLLAACIAPFILAWIIVRGHELTWRPGEVTMIVGMLAFGLIICNGIVLGKPGNSVDIGLAYGYAIGLLGAIGIMAAGVIRQAQGQTRKPPGV
jgi:hypothetical protein